MKENQSIKVSIIVAIYNSAKFLDKLITSIIDQTYKNIEVILVDDGSPDNSGEICDKYAALDSRIKVLHKKNGGACDARNKGLEMVTGEYLSIIDGDDWLEPDYVEYLLKIDSHVMQNKPQERTYHRKYVGILTEINGFKYFVPMSSPKDKDYENGKIKKNNLTTIYLRIRKNCTELFALTA